MKADFEDLGHLSVVSIHGDLTAEWVDALQRQLRKRLDERVRDFVLDLSRTEFVDSRGLEVLLELQDTCADQLGQVRLANVPENLSEVLRITRLSTRFDTCPDVDAAIESLRIG